jgi:putative transposase
MADENNTIENGEVASTEVNAPVQKKQRAPRRAQSARDLKAASPETAPVAKQRKKRGANAGIDTKVPVIAEKPIKTRAKRTPAAVKPAKAVAKASLPALDEMAELLQLEDENKRLRQTLAEKLRAENADLRKRLGLA